jgi:hypothetical protein
LQYGELVPERENFRRELEPRVDRGPKRGQHGNEQGSHAAENGISLWSATATATTPTEYSVGTGFPEERDRQVEQLRKMADLVACDEPDLEMERSFTRAIFRKCYSACGGSAWNVLVPMGVCPAWPINIDKTSRYPTNKFVIEPRGWTS